MTSEPQPGFTGIFIPVEILEMDDLSPNEVILLSWIAALSSNEKGACFASNEYLSKKLKVKENTIAKSISNLRKKGLIEDVSFDGRVRLMRSLHYRKADEIQTKKTIQTRVGKKSNPPLEKNPSPQYIDIKEERKEREVTASPCPSPSAQDVCSFLLEKIIEFCPSFKKPRDLKKWGLEIDRMLRIDKRSVEEIKAVITWAFANDFWRKTISSPSGLRKNFNTILMQMADSKTNSPEVENEKYAYQMVKKHGEQAKKCYTLLEFGPGNIQFTPTQGQKSAEVIDFRTKDFKKKLDDALRRWRIL